MGVLNLLAEKVIPPTAMVGGGSTAVFGWWTANEIAALCGAFCAVGGFFINWYYKHKQWKIYEQTLINKRRFSDPDPSKPGDLSG